MLKNEKGIYFHGFRNWFHNTTYNLSTLINRHRDKLELINEANNLVSIDQLFDSKEFFAKFIFYITPLNTKYLDVQYINAGSHMIMDISFIDDSHVLLSLEPDNTHFIIATVLKTPNESQADFEAKVLCMILYFEPDLDYALSKMEYIRTKGDTDIIFSTFECHSSVELKVINGGSVSICGNRRWYK